MAGWVWTTAPVLTLEGAGHSRTPEGNMDGFFPTSSGNGFPQVTGSRTRTRTFKDHWISTTEQSFPTPHIHWLCFKTLWAFLLSTAHTVIWNTVNRTDYFSNNWFRLTMDWDCHARQWHASICQKWKYDYWQKTIHLKKNVAMATIWNNAKC